MDADLPMGGGRDRGERLLLSDKLSPCRTTNIASLAAGVRLFTPSRHLMWTTVPAFLTSAVVAT